MKPYDPEETFICDSCGRYTKLYYRSGYDEALCIFCDTGDDYDNYCDDEEEYE